MGITTNARVTSDSQIGQPIECLSRGSLHTPPNQSQRGWLVQDAPVVTRGGGLLLLRCRQPRSSDGIKSGLPTPGFLTPRTVKPQPGTLKFAGGINRRPFRAFHSIRLLFRGLAPTAKHLRHFVANEKHNTKSSALPFGRAHAEMSPSLKDYGSPNAETFS